MAYALIGVDIAMRLLLIEKKVARKFLELTGEEAVDLKTVGASVNKNGKDLKRDSQQRGNNAGDAAEKVQEREIQPISNAQTAENQQSSEAPVLETHQIAQTSNKSRLPPVITLLGSRRLLASLWATLVIAAIMTQFDSVVSGSLVSVLSTPSNIFVDCTKYSRGLPICYKFRLVSGR